jgi:hypothetical protein
MPTPQDPPIPDPLSPSPAWPLATLRLVPSVPPVVGCACAETLLRVERKIDRLLVAAKLGAEA